MFWCALCISTSTCASRHNGVQFFISHLASWLRTRRFSDPTFRPSSAANHWKNIVNRDFPTFSCTCIFFLLSLSLLWSSQFFSSPPGLSLSLLWSSHFFSPPPGLFSPLLFHLSILSEVWLLSFLPTLCLFLEPRNWHSTKRTASSEDLPGVTRLPALSGATGRQDRRGACG